jgi:hypothetical protein
MPIPNSDFDFATLQHAQALGDFRSLTNKQNRVLRIHISANIEKGLKALNGYLK